MANINRNKSLGSTAVKLVAQYNCISYIFISVNSTIKFKSLIGH